MLKAMKGGLPYSHVMQPVLDFGRPGFLLGSPSYTRWSKVCQIASRRQYSAVTSQEVVYEMLGGIGGWCESRVSCLYIRAAPTWVHRRI